MTVGTYYRITDYVTTTLQENTRSAGHAFDVIVLATDIDTLSEEAMAAVHEGDTYFSNSNLSAWKIWYSLDNDSGRFAWASTIIYDSTECNIKNNLVTGNTFNTPFAFSGYMQRDPVNGDNYISKVENDLIYEYRFETEPNGSESLTLYKSDVDIYNEEGNVDYIDKFYYRGIIEVDGEEYDY